MFAARLCRQLDLRHVASVRFKSLNMLRHRVSEEVLPAVLCSEDNSIMTQINSIDGLTSFCQTYPSNFFFLQTRLALHDCSRGIAQCIVAGRQCVKQRLLLPSMTQAQPLTDFHLESELLLPDAFRYVRVHEQHDGLVDSTLQEKLATAAAQAGLDLCYIEVAIGHDHTPTFCGIQAAKIDRLEQLLAPEYDLAELTHYLFDDTDS
eukprot:TRINITY_DN12328_c1_g1_i3.p2 TRINITY_DN12328_c1_g1~~TRINITY_DN12328_c1_g1_i3.p2  ORF type:complete len:206 (+),score=45.31 TRINITY_DN12328_c1_g1_i3:2805-3422(+)